MRMYTEPDMQLLHWELEDMICTSNTIDTEEYGVSVTNDELEDTWDESMNII